MGTFAVRPAGRRRKRTVATIPLTDVMTRRPAQVHAGATLSEVLDIMHDRGISSALVPAPDSTAYGILTMRDVVGKVVRHDLDPSVLRARDITTWRLVTARPQHTVQDAAAIMAASGIRRLPVVKGDAIAGIVSDTDLLIALVPKQNWEHVRAVRKERAARRAAAGGRATVVSDLMSAPVLTTDPDSPVQQAVEKMVAGGISSLLITVADGEPVGIVTKRDVVTKVLAQGREAPRVRLGDIMSAPVRTIDAGTTVEACSARMADEAVRRFPVTMGGQIVGIISDSDILAAVIAHRWRGRRRLSVTASAIVADVMRPTAGPLVPAGLPTLTPELSIWEAAERLAQAGAPELPVVQGGQVIGTVHQADILQALEERGAAD